MNRLSAILFLVCLSSTVFATDLTDESEDNNQDFSYGKHATPGATVEIDLHDEEDPDAKPSTVPSEKKITKTDSSNYSVNKFNFLFYFVYKLKYLEDEFKTDDSEQTVDKK